MPEWLGLDTDTIEKPEAFEFDDPWDDRRFFSAGDNQIAGVGDGFARNSPAWIETVKSLRPDFPVYGSMCEANECMQRIVGPENMLLWIGLYPEQMGRFIERVNDFALEILQGADQGRRRPAGRDRHLGRRGLQEGPVLLAGVLARVVQAGRQGAGRRGHAHGLPVIYHGCGNVKRIFEDFIEIGVDAYNPLEAKAGLDVVELRRKYGHRIGFCGNMDVHRLGDRQTATSSRRGPDQAQRGQGRRLHLPIRPLGAEQRLRPDLRLRRQPGARVWAVPAAAGRVRRGGSGKLVRW